jgi:hypothetical protein
VIIMDKNLYRNYPVDPDDEEYTPSASMYDCTGLIPSEPQSEDELDAYMDLYPYLPEDER